MTHIAIVEVLDGRSADRMEKLGDDEYQAAAAVAVAVAVAEMNSKRGRDGHQPKSAAQPRAPVSG
jgi:hypothetical protein